MEDSKQEMEEECRRLQENLTELTENRSSLQDEFADLTKMHSSLIVQLRGDTLAGEGQLHSFHAEKKRIEQRLEELEKQLQEKNDKLLELDARASEYLLRVTTASNSLYDDEDHSEQNESQINLIQKLVNEEMEESERARQEGKEDEASEGSRTSNLGSGSSTTENVSAPQIRIEDDSLASDGVDETSGGSKGLTQTDGQESEGGGEEGEITNEITPPTKDQMISLSVVVSELKRVKDEIGRCISAKDESFVELEKQLQTTKAEMAFLRGSMSDLSFEIHKREDGYQSSERGRSMDRLSISHEDKLDIMNKINILESVVGEEGPDFDDVVVDGRSRSRGGGGGSRDMSPGFRSLSACSISGRVAMLEKELCDSQEKLAGSHRRIKVLTVEKEHKQKECELLQQKVDKVEGKMIELQGTFDQLVNAMMVERDQLAKTVGEKDELISELKKKLEDSKSVDLSLYVPRDELERTVRAVEDKYCDKLEASQRSASELEANHSIEVQNLKKENAESKLHFTTVIENLKVDLEELEKDRIREKKVLADAKIEVAKGKKMADDLEMEREKREKLEGEVQSKVQLSEELSEKCKLLEERLSSSVPHLQQEISQYKEKLSKVYEEKDNLETKLIQLEEEHKELLARNEEFITKLEKFEKDKMEFGSTESLKQQLDEQKQKLTALNSVNDNLSSQINNKDQEIREELNAREATIQELRITLTNNQKQSRENYQMLQDDMAALQIQLSKEKDESQAIISHLKEKLIKAEEEAEKSQVEMEDMKKTIEEQTSKLEGYDRSEAVKMENSTSDSSSAKEEEEEPSGVIISELEGKVKELEKSLSEKCSYIMEMESKIKSSETEETYKSRFEQQMEQIRKLNEFIDKLKTRVEELTGDLSKLQDTVDQLESEKEDVEGERDSLKDELEKLRGLNQVLHTDVEEKKKLG